MGSPRSVALSIAVGLVLGVFPLYGVPTALCVVAALALRLNAPALQLINLLCSPLQLALLVPFNKLGAYLLGTDVGTGHGPAAIRGAIVHAIAGWSCAALPLGLVLYLAAKHFLGRSGKATALAA